jgi:tetratricopeptide (TPR) repeat protein
MGLDTKDAAQDICKVARKLHEAIVGIRGILLLGFLFWVGCSSPEERFAEKMMQANENLENGEVEKAIAILDKLKDDNPKNPQILENLAFAFTQDEDYFTSAFYFNELAKTFPENVDYYLYAAQSWIKAGDTESAIRDYEAYLLENRADWNTWQQIGDLYLQSDQTAKAIHAYSNSSQIRFNPELDLTASLLATESGNLREAEAGFERLLIVEDDSVARQAHIGLLQIKHKRRQWNEVDRLMKQVEKRFPEAADAPELSEVKSAHDEFKKVAEEEKAKDKEEEERLQKLIEQQRARAEQIAAARRAALTQQEQPEVVAPSQLAVNEEEQSEENPQITPTSSIVAPPKEKTPIDLVLEDARRISSTNSNTVVAKYWDAINLGEDTGVAYYELARVYYNRGEFSEAEMTSLEAMRRQPESNRYLLTYLQIIRKTKAKPDVVAEIRKYRQLYPKNPDLVLLLARLYAEPSGDPVAARSLYNLFFQMAPNHPDIERARYEARGI